MSNVTYLRIAVQQCVVQLYGPIALRFNQIEFNQIENSYNNSLRRLLGLPKYNSASEMIVNLGILSFGELLRKFVFSLNTRISVSHNSCLQSIYNSKILLFSKIWAWWDVILTI